MEWDNRIAECLTPATQAFKLFLFEKFFYLLFQSHRRSFKNEKIVAKISQDSNVFSKFSKFRKTKHRTLKRENKTNDASSPLSFQPRTIRIVVNVITRSRTKQLLVLYYRCTIAQQLDRGIRVKGRPWPAPLWRADQRSRARTHRDRRLRKPGFNHILS